MAKNVVFSQENLGFEPNRDGFLFSIFHSPFYTDADSTMKLGSKSSLYALHFWCACVVCIPVCSGCACVVGVLV